MADTCYEAELALSMAAWNCDVDTVEILLKHGASVEAVKNKGDNVFHSLIQVGLTPQTNLLLPTTFSIAPTIWWCKLEREQSHWAKCSDYKKGEWVALTSKHPLCLIGAPPATRDSESENLYIYRVSPIGYNGFSKHAQNEVIMIRVPSIFSWNLWV